MIRTRHTWLFVAAISVMSAAPAHSQKNAPEHDPRLKVVYQVDSGGIQSPHISADGRWVVFGRSFGATSSIWIVELPAGKPIRITSEGHYDLWPIISPMGDRVFFTSSRPDREAGGYYLMSIPIDAATKQPSGPPRQLVPDKLQSWWGRVVRDVTSDGKWIAYNQDPKTLNIVGVDGGTPRLLATGNNIAPGVFSRDNQWLFFEDNLAEGGVLKKVAVGGGAVTTLVDGKMDHVQPFLPDPEKGYVLLHSPLPGEKEYSATLFDFSGRKVAATMRPNAPNPSMRGDKGGISGVFDSYSEGLNQIALSSRAITKVLSPATIQPFGLLADGSIAAQSIAQPYKGEQLTLLTLGAADGKTTRQVTLGKEVAWVDAPLTDRKLIAATGTGADNSTQSLFAIDPRTGDTRKLTSSLVGGCCHRGLLRVGMAEKVGDAIRISSLDADGKSQLVRTFPVAVYDSMWDRDIHGARIAFALPNARRDSVDIQIADGANDAPRTIASFPIAKDAGHSLDLTWSPNGELLSAVFPTVGGKDYRVMFLTPTPRGAPSAVATALETGLSDWDSYDWLPDASGIVMVGTGKGETGNRIILRPVMTNRAPTVLTTDRNANIDGLAVSLDGRSVYYSFTVPRGGSIFSFDFFPGGVKW